MDNRPVGLYPASTELVEISLPEAIRSNSVIFTNMSEFERDCLHKNFPFMKLLPIK